MQKAAMMPKRESEMAIVVRKAWDNITPPSEGPLA